MKTFRYILIAIASFLLIYNITLLDFDNLFEGDSVIAGIGVLASACVILLLLIFQVSQKIAKKKR
ncbi:hypothetical protein [Ulvibacter litoralis]|uniref:Uncharacterized protein n=1 Tax=Ulvibacter litoralis TaxID=227084 RepID=A0A1G7DN99_9FLAO|nr:hypothetical protein [Ulvibacter litoralis]GHC42943.1 hypothetical protein GCM10008083_01490 [Ulvibacter litoralis]SDE52626.1 hypothetical protein SAMN05421855_1011064 [Ulvibacter litoralis]